jgi:hypothetical protein
MSSTHVSAENFAHILKQFKLQFVQMYHVPMFHTANRHLGYTRWLMIPSQLSSEEHPYDCHEVVSIFVTSRAWWHAFAALATHIAVPKTQLCTRS